MPRPALVRVPPDPLGKTFSGNSTATCRNDLLRRLDEHGQLLPLGPCDEWRCPRCRWKKARAVQRRVENGLYVALLAGQDVHRVDFTLRPNARWSTADLFGIGAKVVRGVRRSHGIEGYCWVAQLSPSGRLHAHGLLIGGDLPSAQRVRELAYGAGGGHNVFVGPMRRSLGDAVRVSGYLSRTVAYDAPRLHAGRGHRLRMATFARGW